MFGRPFFLKFAPMQISKTTVKNIVQIEIFIPANTASTQLVFPFPDQPFLRDKKIVGMAISVNTFSPFTNATNVCKELATNAGTTLLNNSLYLTLQDNKGNQIVQNLPILELNPYTWNSAGAQSNTNSNGYLALNPATIVWPKSFLSCPTSIGADATNRCFLFTVFYQL